MSEPEDQSGPSLEEAFATLSQLAGVFLNGGARPPEDAVAAEHAELFRPAAVVVDEDGAIQGVDAEAQRLLGCRPTDLIGLPAGSFFGPTREGSQPVLSAVRRPDGTEVSLWVTRSEMTIGGQPYAVLGLHEPNAIGGRRTELRYRHLVEQIPAVVFTAALDGGLFDIYVSPQIEGLLGYSQAEWVADPVLWYERLHPDDRRKLDGEFAKGCVTGGPFKTDCRFLTRDNNIVWVHGEARLIKDAHGAPILLQGVAFDITDTKRAEEVARASLKEKETLLKEIHHRVKNNLQVTSSLLRLQADRVHDDSAKRALREGQDRIRSMALVHEMLYRSKDLSSVDLGEYVRDLARQMLRSHTVEPANIRIEIKLVPVLLPIDLAVPCGLILNELISNALKHAFPNGMSGVIDVELYQDEESNHLIVRDNGVGLPAGATFAAGTTLGVRLVRTLTDQIDGELLVRSDGGTEVHLRIPRRAEGRG